MEWNWRWNGYGSGKNGMIDVTPFLLLESTGDSEEVKADVHHQEEEEEEKEAMDVSRGVLFQDDDEDDDDAQSCSYDHSSYIKTSYSYSNHDQAQGLINDCYDHEDDEEGIDDGDVDDDDQKNKNWGESKLVGPSMQQKRSRKFCVDSSNQKEIDRKFWETCLAS